MNVGRVVKHAFLCENNPPLAVEKLLKNSQFKRLISPFLKPCFLSTAAYPTRKALGMVMPPYVLKGSLNF